MRLDCAIGHVAGHIAGTKGCLVGGKIGLQRDAGGCLGIAGEAGNVDRGERRKIGPVSGNISLRINFPTLQIIALCIAKQARCIRFECTGAGENIVVAGCAGVCRRADDEETIAGNGHMGIACRARDQSLSINLRTRMDLNTAGSIGGVRCAFGYKGRKDCFRSLVANCVGIRNIIRNRCHRHRLRGQPGNTGKHCCSQTHILSPILPPAQRTRRVAVAAIRRTVHSDFAG